MSVALDRPVRDLLEAIAAPASQTTPDLGAIGVALSELATDADYLAGFVRQLDGRAGAVSIHAPERGPRLVLVHRPEGEMSAVHDHGTWVAISPVSGVETHRHWRVSKDGHPEAGVELAEERFLEVAEVATLLPPDDVHDHGHTIGRGEPAYALVLLGDDQTRFTRNEWDLATGRHRVLLPGDGGRWLASEPFPTRRER